MQAISVDTFGRVNINNRSDISGVQGSLTVGTSAIEVKVGGSALANRTYVTLYNNSNNIVYWGYTSGVTTSSGTPIVKGQFASWLKGASFPIYVISGSPGNDTRVTEA